MTIIVKTHFKIEYTVPAREGFEPADISGEATFSSWDALLTFVRASRKDMIINGVFFVRSSEKEILLNQDMLKFLK
ncbi:hypothetical protein D3C87_952530 [compost metagenome]